MPHVIATDKPRSYGIAKCQLFLDVERRQSQHLNKHAENSPRAARHLQRPSFTPRKFAYGTGQKIRVLTVVDTFSRFSPVIDPRFSYRAEDVVATLERVCVATGYPKTIRVDQGSEFVSRGPRSLGLR